MINTTFLLHGFTKLDQLVSTMMQSPFWVQNLMGECSKGGWPANFRTVWKWEERKQEWTVNTAIKRKDTWERGGGYEGWSVNTILLHPFAAYQDDKRLHLNGKLGFAAKLYYPEQTRVNSPQLPTSFNSHFSDQQQLTYFSFSPFYPHNNPVRQVRISVRYCPKATQQASVVEFHGIRTSVSQILVQN